jgi:hypothetical protein
LRQPKTPLSEGLTGSISCSQTCRAASGPFLRSTFGRAKDGHTRRPHQDNCGNRNRCCASASRALVDGTVWKRALIVIAAGSVALGAITLSPFPSFWPAVAAQSVIGACDAAFPPAIAAISLGTVGRKAFTRRVGRNEAFNHAGNVAAAIAAGLAGYLIAPAAVLWLVAVVAAASACAALSIDGGAIDHSLARGLDNNGDGADWKRPGGLRVIFESRPLLFFTAAITLFHFANAAMLPLIGERLSQGHKDSGSLFIAACNIAAQAVMIPMAVLAGGKSGTWGRKPIFLVGFAVLPDPRSALHALG